MTDQDAETLVAWYRSEFERRTIAVKNNTARLDWVSPYYRVTWAELASHAKSIGIILTTNDRITLLRKINT